MCYNRRGSKLTRFLPLNLLHVASVLPHAIPLCRLLKRCILSCGFVHSNQSYVDVTVCVCDSAEHLAQSVLLALAVAVRVLKTVSIVLPLNT